MAPEAPSRILIVIADQQDPVIDELRALLGETGAANPIRMETCSSLAAAPLKIDQVQRAILLSVISKPSELQDQLGFARAIRPYIEDGNVILVALNRLNHRDVPGILKRMGYAEVISYSAIRATGIRARLEVLFSEFAHPELSSFDPFGHAPLWTPGKLVEPDYELVAPLELAANCWLLAHPDDVRVVRNHWVLQLLGPGPSTGRWGRMENAPLRQSDGHSVWEWRPRNEQGRALVGPDGSWAFWGKKPQFENFHWVFVSRSPKLTFCRGREPVANFLSVGKDHALRISQNSEIALSKWPAIYASVVGEYRTQQKAPEITDVTVRSAKGASRGEAQKAAMSGETQRISREAAEKTSRFFMMSQIQKHLKPGKTLFNPVEDQRTRRSYLEEFQGIRGAVQLWTPQQRIRFKSKLLDSLPEKNRIRVSLPAGREPAKLLQELSSQPKIELFVNIGLPRGGVFFLGQTDGVSEAGDSLMISVPRMIYEVQRRLYFRLEPEQGAPVWIVLGGKPYRIEKLSAGGVSILTEASEAERFAPGKIFQNVTFEVNRRSISCGAEVRWSKRLEDGLVGQDCIAGLQFKNLRAADQQRLNLFVLESRFEYLKGLVRD